MRSDHYIKTPLLKDEVRAFREQVRELRVVGRNLNQIARALSRGRRGRGRSRAHRGDSTCLRRLERQRLSGQRVPNGVIATHSPILMAYPDALIYSCGPEGVVRVAYQETEHYRVTRDFLLSPERMMRTLFEQQGG